MWWCATPSNRKKGAICKEISSLCKASMISKSCVMHKNASAYSNLNYLSLSALAYFASSIGLQAQNSKVMGQRFRAQRSMMTTTVFHALKGPFSGVLVCMGMKKFLGASPQTNTFSPLLFHSSYKTFSVSSNDMSFMSSFSKHWGLVICVALAYNQYSNYTSDKMLYME